MFGGIPLYVCLYSNSLLVAEPSILFSVDFSTYPTGSMANATFVASASLRFSRDSQSTVQTSPSTIISSCSVQTPVFGASGSVSGLVIQHNTRNNLGSGGAFGGTSIDRSPRDLNVSWNAGATVVVTSRAAAGPDGQIKATQTNVTSSGYSPYGNIDGGMLTERFTFSSWQRSVASGTNGDMQMIMNNGVASGPVKLATGSNTWQRLILNKYATSQLNFAAADGRDYSSSGGQTARARNLYIDFLQMELGDFPTEAIEDGHASRANDRIWYPSGSYLIATGSQMKFYASVYPKMFSSQSVYYCNGLTYGTSAALYLWSFNSGSNYARIPSGTNKLELCIGGVSGSSLNTMSFNAYDFLEFYMEVGGNQPTIAWYRKNGGVTSSFIFAGGNFGLVTPSGSIAILHNDNGNTYADSGQFPCWVKEIRFYNRNGSAS